MRRWLRENSLTLVFLGLFVAAVFGQALVGHSDFNHQQVAHQDDTISLWRYVTSSSYWVDVMENWQSEYLQFALFILGTVWLVQRGSTESKPPGEEGGESDEEQKIGEHADPESPEWAKTRGLRTLVYANSLLALMVTIWLGSWLAQLVTGRVEYNAEQLDHHEAALSLWQYAGSSDFWNRTLQNWQSEFLAVASMVVFSIWLRQRGSSQSKPVGEAHVTTGAEG
ncbi:MAG TPA: DUF6766 family protein [Capillimicrobium sp.]|nr:DUF6766 family protein [Capillimicrobium sp.]